MILTFGRRRVTRSMQLETRKVVGLVSRNRNAHKSKEAVEINLHDKTGELKYTFKTRASFDSWCKLTKVTLGRTLEVSYKGSLRVENYFAEQQFVDRNMYTVFGKPTDARKVIGLSGNKLVYCYVKTVGDKTTFYRPVKNSEMYLTLPSNVEKLIMETEVLDFV